ncbi:MAG: RNA polymerase sigma factor SigJ [Bryobacteraceae bacterium]
MTARDRVFQQHRPLILSLAYRMLGSWTDAEDAAQEVWLRWRSTQDTIASPRAYLSTIAARVCLDLIKSAYRRREKYPGPWLPEPVADPVPDPLERTEQISYAFLVLLETLTPAERAVFVLREAFDAGYPEIARLLDLSEANCRQILKRARDRLAAGRARFAPDTARCTTLMQAFFQASAEGDTAAIERMLHEDAVFTGDGGGKAPAAMRPVMGPERIAKLMAGLGRLAPADLRVKWITVNGGAPAMVAWSGGAVITLGLCEFEGDRIRRVFFIRNPDKLERFRAIFDASSDS